MIYEKHLKNASVVHIENMEIDPYTSIGSKAFLSCKNVYEIKLPDTICEIGDWAFAHMKDLKRIIVPANNIRIGRDAFLDCNSLKEIVIYPENQELSGISYLLASCVTILNSYRLLDFKMSVADNKSWCEVYDAELLKFIRQEDGYGFEGFIVGWFDDEGEEEQLKKYIEKQREDKLSLCFLRLKYNMNISLIVKAELVNYIKAQIENENLEWELFRDKLSDDIQYVKIASDNNIISNELKSELITYINKRNGNPEIVAYLLSLEEEKKSIDQMFEL